MLHLSDQQIKNKIKTKTTTYITSKYLHTFSRFYITCKTRDRVLDKGLYIKHENQPIPVQYLLWINFICSLWNLIYKNASQGLAPLVHLRGWCASYWWCSCYKDAAARHCCNIWRLYLINMWVIVQLVICILTRANLRAMSSNLG